MVMVGRSSGSLKPGRRYPVGSIRRRNTIGIKEVDRKYDDDDLKSKSKFYEEGN